MAEFKFLSDEEYENQYGAKIVDSPVESGLSPQDTWNVLNGVKESNDTWQVIKNIGTSLTNVGKDMVRNNLYSIQGLRDANPDLQLGTEATKLVDDLANAELLQRQEVQADSWLGKLGYDAVEAIGQFGVYSAAGPFSLPLMATQIFGSRYNEERKKGVSVDRAFKASLYETLPNLVLERVGFKMQSLPFNTRLKHGTTAVLAEKLLGEPTTEALQEIPSYISSIWAENPGKTPEELAKIAMDNLPELGYNMAYSAAVAFVSTGAITGTQYAVQRGFQKEVHKVKLDALKEGADKIKESGVNPQYAATAINTTYDNETVTVDAQAINAYAQEAGIEKVAESLGVTTDEITEAANNGDTIDISIGNYQATDATFEGFHDAVKNTVAFEDGGYTVANEEAEKEAIKLAEQNRQALQVEKDRLTNEMLKAGVTPQVINAELNLLTRATFVDDPVEMLKNLHVQKGADGSVTFAQSNNQTETPEFRRWFKDSKVVDENGKPLVVYHGTQNGGFSVFAPEQSGYDNTSVASWFSRNKEVAAEDYAVDENGVQQDSLLYNVYLSMQKPLVVESRGQVWNRITPPKEMGGEVTDTESIVKWAKGNGYDGVIFKEIFDGDPNKGNMSDVYAVFDSTQIKSATGNNGNFDANNPNIYRQDPKTEKKYLDAKTQKAVADSIDNGGMVELNASSAQDKASRDFMRQTMEKNGLDKKTIDDVFAVIDDVTKNLKSLYKDFPSLKAWEEKGVNEFLQRYQDSKLGLVPVRSAFKKNGEYFLNIDLGSLCTKRESMDTLMRILIDNGMWKNVGATQIERLKDILKSEGMLTACDICFVETKRARALSDASKFAFEWKSVLLGLGIDDNNPLGVERKLTAKQKKILEEMAGKDFKEAYAKYIPEDRKRGKVENTNAKGETKLVEIDDGITDSKMQKIAKLMLEDNSLIGDFKAEWLLTTKGTDWLFRTYGTHTNLPNVIAGMFGSATAKPLEGFNIYDPLSWRKSFDVLSSSEKALDFIYSIGGLRAQSFTDFNPMLALDYLQMFADLEARRLPIHIYTKVPALVELFGKTGAMFNMSLVPKIETGIDEEHAGLKWNEKTKEWDYSWADESFNPEKAFELRQRKEYGGRVGTIAVGVSDEHIRKMLDDDQIDMIIPYHSSGMSNAVKVKTGLNKATDYTDSQTTKGVSANKDFSYNDTLQKLKDPRKTAQAYLDWCKKNKYKPKFEQFSKHKNYYKLLEDFRGYDNNGKAVIQGAVKVTGDSLPSNFTDILRDALNARQSETMSEKEMKSNKTLMDKVSMALKPQRLDGEVRTAFMKQLTNVLGKSNVSILRKDDFLNQLEKEYAKKDGADKASKSVEIYRTGDGIVYGFAVGKKIYLNENTMNANTPAHEFTHIWSKVVQKANPKLWSEGVKLLKKHDYWKQVVEDKLYDNIKGNDNAIASEVLARIVGEQNEEYIRRLIDPTIKHKKGNALMDSIIEWARKTFNAVRSFLGGSENLTLEEFQMMPLKAIWDKNSANEFKKYLDSQKTLQDEQFSPSSSPALSASKPNPAQEVGAKTIGEQWIKEHPFVKDYSLSAEENIAKALEIAEAYKKEFGETYLHNEPERHALRKKIIELLYGNGAKNKERKAFIVIGLPASGKSSSVAEPLAQRYGALLIDSDEAKKHLPEYSDGLLASAVHEESSNIADKVQKHAMEIGDNIVLPLVGNTEEKLRKRIENLKEYGYYVEMHLVNLPLEKAVNRSIGRFVNENRVVPLDYIRSVGLHPKENFDKIKIEKGVDYYVEWNNDVDRGTRPRLLEEKEPKGQESSDRLGGRRNPVLYANGILEEKVNNETTQKHSAEKQSAFSNGYNQTEKGSYNPETNVISLFQGSDPSTVIHETWHFFIEQMYSAIARGEASQQVINDFDKLLNYAGMDKAKWQAAWQKREEARAMLQTAMETFDQEGAAKARQAISEATNEMRDAHEKLAEAGETYLMEGKAPSHELKRVFRQFAKWLKDVYRTINRNPNAIPLTDDVREVFDRMLAAEDDINEMARINGYFNSLPSVITDNMSDATKAKVEDYIEKARDKAVDILTKRAMRNYTKERKAEIDTFRSEILPSVEKEVGEYRVYKCGVTKKDINRYAKLKNAESKSGTLNEDDAAFIMQTDLTAEQFGYSSTDEMFKDIQSAPTKNQAITQMVNERIEMMTSADERTNYEEAVRESFYNENEALLIGVEQALIEDYANKAKAKQNEQAGVNAVQADIKEANRLKKQQENRINAAVAAAHRQQAKNAAKTDISKMNIKDAMRTSKFITNERNEAIKAAKYLAKKDFDNALIHKNLQAYWHAMASESIKVKRNKQKNDKFIRTQLKAKREVYFNDECFGAVSQLFVRMGIAREKHIEAATNSPYPSLSAYVEAMLPKTDIIDIADWIINEGVDISDTNALTLEQYNDVIDAIKNIKAVAKDLKGTNMFNTKQNYQQLKVEMKKALNKLPVKFTPNPNEQQTAGTFETYFASLENLDTMLEKLDNMSFGFFSKHFGNEIKHCNDREYEHKYIYDKACKDALDKWLPTKQERLAASEPIYYGELNTSLSRFSLVQLLMNFGNADNAKRVCETPPVGLEQSSLWVRESETVDRETARQMTEENVLGFLQRVLTKSDVEYAQNIINACGLFWGEKNELERRTKGFGMNKVEATPRVLNINGETVVKRGGYFPLVRNSEMGSHAAAVEIQPDDPLQGQNIRTYHVNEGATKKRTNARYPISLVAGAEKQWIYESIHDLCWRETMSDFRRIINDEEMFGMLKSRMGLARFQAFKEMLEYAADPNNSKSMQLGEKGLSNIIGFMQQRTSHAAIMLNLKVVSQNFANAFLYGNSVKGYTMADNLHALGNLFMHNLTPSGYNNMYNFVMSKSAFMRERQDIPDITIRDILQGQAKGKTSQKLKQLGLMNESGEFKWEEYTRLVGVKLMAITDNMTALPNWIQAYNKQIANGATEQEAVDFADTVCRRVLGSSRATDVSPIQRGKPLMKMLTMFQSFFNARWNEFLRMEKTAEKQWSMGAKKEAFATAFSYIVSKWLLQSTMALALAAQNPFGIDDKDGWPELLKELKNYSFTMMGWGGQIAGSVFGTLFGMNEFDYRMSAIESSISKLNIAAKRIKSDKATGQDVAEGLMDIGGMAIGIPSQLNKLFWNAFDITFNDMSFEPQDIFRRRPKKERND